MIVSRNPLKELRERLGVTQAYVAEEANVSKQFIIKAEQGCYAEPPESLLAFYSDELDFDLNEVRANYYAFQLETRKSNYGELIEPWVFRLVGIKPKHPFIHWREMSGINSSAEVPRLFCLHPAIIFKFENTPWAMGSVPESLTVALLESGYSPETLQNLEDTYQAFKRVLREELKVVN